MVEIGRGCTEMRSTSASPVISPVIATSCPPSSFHRDRKARSSTHANNRRTHGASNPSPKMSVSRPKRGKIVPRPPILPGQPGSPAPEAPAVSRQSINRPHSVPNLPVRSIVAGPSVLGFQNGNQKRFGTPSSAPKAAKIYHPSDEDEDDDFEEVAVPAIATTSSPYPGTPTTAADHTNPATPGTVTTAPSIDDDFDADSRVESGSEVAAESDDAEDDMATAGVIRVEIGGETIEERAKRIAMALRKKPITSKDRAIRLEGHKLHVLALLASARIRNRWCANGLLKARLLSLLPHPLQSAFTIPPSRFPDRAQRSRLFFDALQALVTWWSQSFFDIPDPTIGLRTRPWEDVQETVDQLPRLSRSDFTGTTFGKGKGREKEQEEAAVKLEQGAGGERLRTVNSMMKKVLQQEGSRDVSAQLFVAMARACGLGARLVASLQAVPWRAEKGTPKKSGGAGRGGKSIASRQGDGLPSENEDDEDMEEVPIPNTEDQPGGPGSITKKIKRERPTLRAGGKRRLQDPADVYRLKKARPELQKVGQAKPKPKRKEDLSQQPPVFWAEVFSRSDQRWIPVDPIQGIIRKKTHYEPTSDAGPIRMSYVVAFEEDGYARDVTLRYTKNFGAKTVKLRPPPRKDEPDWWPGVMSFLQRPYRLNRDELEDAELETSQVSEAMPLHLNGFKDHPIYVLERHLKRDEIIMLKREVGRFRGEPVYRRLYVQQCKSAETWMRTGRRVKERQEPMKWVKQNAVTLHKRRAQELATQEGQGDLMQGLYSEAQTEVYRPPPIQDGFIPHNSYGNMDLWASTMLPIGAVHLPYKGIAKVAKALGISYAEACTGFDFKKRMAIPVLTGIVVAVENEALTMDAYWESAAAQEEKERVKREDRALKRWAKLINGLRVKARLQAEYGEGDLDDQHQNPLANAVEEKATSASRKKTAASVIADTNQRSKQAWVEQARDGTPDSAEEDLEPVSTIQQQVPEAIETHSAPILLGDSIADSRAENHIATTKEAFSPLRVHLVINGQSAHPVDRSKIAGSRKRKESHSGSTESEGKPTEESKRPIRSTVKRESITSVPVVSDRKLRSRAKPVDYSRMQMVEAIDPDD